MIIKYTVTGALFLAGCATMMPELVPVPKVKHIHKIFVVDQKGNPLSGATVKLTGEENKLKVVDTTLTSPEDGILSTELIATSDPNYPSIYAYATYVNWEVTKDGYYKGKAFTHSSKSGSKSDQIDSVQIASDTVKLLMPTDFFSEKYFSTIDKSEIKSKIMAFIDDIRVEGYMAESYLVPYSIDLMSFKSKNYLKFDFENSNVYNSLKLNKYDIGKRLFDEVVRKVLNPLNDHISDPKAFYGYNLTVIGFTKDFSNEYATNTKLNYNFLMPADVVGKYKEKEITGQGLLDASVILLDDERIDLKLQ